MKQPIQFHYFHVGPELQEVDCLSTRCAFFLLGGTREGLLGCPPPYIASNGCVQLGWGTLAHHDSYRICPDVLWDSAAHRICPAYHSSWGIQQNLSSR